MNKAGVIHMEILANQDGNERSGAVFSYLPLLVNLFIFCEVKFLHLHPHVLTDYADGEKVL